MLHLDSLEENVQECIESSPFDYKLKRHLLYFREFELPNNNR